MAAGTSKSKRFPTAGPRFMRTTDSISGPHRFSTQHQSCKWKLISLVSSGLKPKMGVPVIMTYHLGAEHHATKAPWEISAVGGKAVWLVCNERSVTSIKRISGAMINGREWGKWQTHGQRRSLERVFLNCSTYDGYFFNSFISDQNYLRFYKLICCSYIRLEEAYPMISPR
jgi:hypothetical protein